MDNQDMNNKENSVDETRVLGEEDLEKVNGGGGGTNDMLCPDCKRNTPHTQTSDGLYVCNICNAIHKKTNPRLF